MDYQTAAKLFTKRYSHRRRLDGLNNTYLVRSTGGDGAIHVRLYRTNIVTFFASGSFTVHCGGYFKAPTPNRFERYLPTGCRMWSETFQGGGREGDKIAFLRTPRGVLPWHDGVVITPDFHRSDLEEMNKHNASGIRAKILQYARDYTKRLVQQGLPGPKKLGDCYRCIKSYKGTGNNRTHHDPNHYLEHILTGAMPSSLILVAAVLYDPTDLSDSAEALFEPNRALWKKTRTRLDELRQTEAALMGCDATEDDPRKDRAGLRDALERFLLERVGFEIFEQQRGLRQGMYRGETRDRRMGW
jgi:hypothetical protein